MARAVSRIPRSLIEMKTFEKTDLTGSSTSYAYSSIATDMTQGDGGNQFIGSKFRLMSLKIKYDFSSVTLQSGVRIAIVIPKIPSAIPYLGSSIDNWDAHSITVLKDILLPNDSALKCGIVDLKGPINIELDVSGSSPLKNNVYIFVYSLNNGSLLRSDFSYTANYLDA